MDTRKYFKSTDGSSKSPQFKLSAFERIRSMVHFAFADLSDKELL